MTRPARITPLFLLLTACGAPPGDSSVDACGGGDGGVHPVVDAAAPRDGSVDVVDAARPADLASPDLARPDLAMRDLAMRDLASPDLAKPDLASPDLAKPDLASPDLATAAVLHRRCGWIGPGDSAGASVFAAHADWYDAIHPDWYALNSDSVTVRALSGADNATVRQAAAAHGVRLVPLIAAVEDASWIRTMMSSPTLRSQHIRNLVALAVNKGYDGLDLDYEHL